jgi:hypothetical protein
MTSLCAPGQSILLLRWFFHANIISQSPKIWARLENFKLWGQHLDPVDVAPTDANPKFSDLAQILGYDGLGQDKLGWLLFFRPSHHDLATAQENSKTFYPNSGFC